MAKTHRTFFDLTGQVFGQLTVQGLAPKSDRRRKWICRCTCGNTAQVCTRNLRSLITSSCGCLRVTTNRRHGQTRTRTYYIWVAMKKRCLVNTCPTYHNYGGRGITVCERWLDFTNFFKDMGECPPKHSLERIDNDGNYCPENCTWIPRSNQQNNKRTSVMLTYDDRTQCLSLWCKDLHLNYSRTAARLRRGWTVVAAFNTPPSPTKPLSR